MKMKRQKLLLKKGDLAKVIAGNEKGKIAKIIAVDTLRQRVCLEGLNMRTHHIKPTQKDPKGSIQKKEGSMHISNLMIVDPSDNVPTRIGRRKNKENKLERYAKKTGNTL